MAKEKKEPKNSFCNGLPKQYVQSNCSLDQITQEALNDIFANEQETYQDFLDGFTYLNEDEASKGSMRTSKPCTHELVNFSADCASVSKVNDVNSYSTNAQAGTTDTDYDEVQQEEIGLGSIRTSVLFRTENLSHGNILLDNFIEDQSLETDNYVPSICTEEKSDFNEETCCAQENSDASSMDRIILPGETENNCVTTNMPVHQRYLNIRTKKTHTDGRMVGKDLEGASSGDHQEHEECEVEAFHLDEDFDYDNIQTTPKFHFLLKRM